MAASRMCSYVFLVLLFVLVYIKDGLGIRCYVCSKSKECNEFKELPATEKVGYEINCDHLPEAGYMNFTYCRKINQDIDGDKSVVRQCATAGDLNKDCYKKTGTYHIKMEYCECDTPLCNHGNAISSTKFHVVLSLLGCVVCTVLRRTL